MKKLMPPVRLLLATSVALSLNIPALAADATGISASTRAEVNQLAEALKLEDKAVTNELRDEQELAMGDIGMLWQAAVERRGSIRYAIEKLSRRDATGQPVGQDTFTKRMLQSLTRIGGAASSMWSQNPAGLIGSNMINEIMATDPQESALSRVTDADMVILAKEVESLQSEIIETYFSYRHAKERLAVAEKATDTMQKYFERAQTMKGVNAETLQPLMNAIYETSQQDENAAQQALQTARTELTLLVGSDAVMALEK